MIIYFILYYNIFINQFQKLKVLRFFKIIILKIIINYLYLTKMFC